MAKVGIIGLGNIFDKTKDILFNIPDFEITALCDMSQDRLKEYEGKLFTTTDYAELLDKCDVVMISTPPKTHYPIAKFFMEKGKDVIVEKPLTMSPQELKSFKELREKGGNFYSLLHYSFGKEIVWWQEHGKEFGVPNKIVAVFDDPYYASGQLDAHAVGLGGAYIDSTINSLSGIYRLYPGKLEAKGRKLRMDPKTNVDIYANSKYEINFGGKKIDVDVTINWDCQEKMKGIYLYYPDRTILLDGHEQTVIDCDRTQGVLYQGEGTRMLNHYEGMLNEYTQIKDNFDFSYNLHRAILENMRDKKAQKQKDGADREL